MALFSWSYLPRLSRPSAISQLLFLVRSTYCNRTKSTGDGCVRIVDIKKVPDRQVGVPNPREQFGLTGRLGRTDRSSRVRVLKASQIFKWVQYASENMPMLRLPTLEGSRGRSWGLNWMLHEYRVLAAAQYRTLNPTVQVVIARSPLKLPQVVCQVPILIILPVLADEVGFILVERRFHY
jgi:hypothetical protein